MLITVYCLLISLFFNRFQEKQAKLQLNTYQLISNVYIRDT